MPAPTPEELVEAVRRDGHGLGEAADRAGAATVVAACGGWDVGDLVWHVAEVHWFWRHVVALQVADHAEVPLAERPPPAELLAYYRDGVERLHAVLAATAPGTPVWTWAPRRDVAFVQRRMAHETAVHRWDAEAAAGSNYRPEPVLAGDGIDEVLTIFLRAPVDGAAAITGTVHLHCTDIDDRWLVRPGAGGAVSVTRECAPADVTVRAPAGDLLLVLWRRLDPADVEVVGDARVLDSLLARAVPA